MIQYSIWNGVRNMAIDPSKLNISVGRGTWVKRCTSSREANSTLSLTMGSRFHNSNLICSRCKMSITFQPIKLRQNWGFLGGPFRCSWLLGKVLSLEKSASSTFLAGARALQRYILSPAVLQPCFYFQQNGQSKDSKCSKCWLLRSFLAEQGECGSIFSLKNTLLDQIWEK